MFHGRVGLEQEMKTKKDKKSRMKNTENPILVKCLECHCIGSLMNTHQGTVLFPERVRRTFVDQRPNLIRTKIKKAKKVFSKVKNTATDVKFLKSIVTNKNRTTKKGETAKTKFRGILSDEFEREDSNKSWKRLSIQYVFILDDIFYITDLISAMF